LDFTIVEAVVEEPRRSFVTGRQAVSVLTLSLRQLDDRSVDIRWTRRILVGVRALKPAIAPTGHLFDLF